MFLVSHHWFYRHSLANRGMQELNTSIPKSTDCQRPFHCLLRRSIEWFIPTYKVVEIYGPKHDAVVIYREKYIFFIFNRYKRKINYAQTQCVVQVQRCLSKTIDIQPYAHKSFVLFPGPRTEWTKFCWQMHSFLLCKRMCHIIVCGRESWCKRPIYL
jgi:hypothetical protein